MPASPAPSPQSPLARQASGNAKHLPINAESPLTLNHNLSTSSLHLTIPLIDSLISSLSLALSMRSALSTRDMNIPVPRVTRRTKAAAPSSTSTSPTPTPVIEEPQPTQKKLPPPRKGAKANSVSRKKKTSEPAPQPVDANSDTDTLIINPPVPPPPSNPLVPLTSPLVTEGLPPPPPVPILPVGFTEIRLPPSQPDNTPPRVPSSPITCPDVPVAVPPSLVIDPALLSGLSAHVPTAPPPGPRQCVSDAMDVDDPLSGVHPGSTAEYDALLRENGELRLQLEGLMRDEEAVDLGSVPQHDFRPGSKPLPRPHGAGKKGWNLLKAMGLNPESTKDKEFYNGLMCEARRAAAVAGLDPRLSILEQEVDRLAQAYAEARRTYPYLRNFEHDWVTYEFIKQALVNKRKYTKRKSSGKVPPQRQTRNTPLGRLIQSAYQ
ncbi:hypothetical protein FRB99_002795 [Tulasnella sp. 403]|nr:hypothetical protein FRB99_002795 [Tulasnella sp. 403]